MSRYTERFAHNVLRRQKNDYNLLRGEERAPNAQRLW